MAVSIRLTPGAAKDTARGYRWYERQRTGLGEDFLSAVDACLQAVRRAPQMHPAVHESYRRALIRRFPYAVFYEISGDQVIIYGIFHTARNPKRWEDRLP